METLNNKKLVSRLTKLECDMQEMHLRGYDKHIGMLELNKHTRRSRKERIVRNVKQVLKDIVLYGLPYIIGVALMIFLMNLGGR